MTRNLARANYNWPFCYFRALHGASSFSPSLFMSLLGSVPRPSKERMVPHLEEDYSYLSNRFGHALEEELEILAHYTRRASAALSLSGVECSDTL